jgi:iron(III) transport system permease protein
MLAWRLAIGLLLAGIVGIPLALPFLDAPARTASVDIDTDRLLALGANTLMLVGGTVALALPAGVLGAVLLFRSDLPFQKTFRFLTVLGLFVPLPLVVSAWQAALGQGGLLPMAGWENRPGQPWPSGLGPAIWLSAMASVPWVILLVGQGLCRVEGELEEDALLTASPWSVLWRVTLPRCRAVLGAAALWVALQTAAEITITDMLEVRTYAEEVLVQISMGGPEGTAGAVAVSFPSVALTWLGLVWLVPRLGRSLPPLQSMTTPPPLLTLGKGRWGCAAALAGVIFFITLVPLASLVWKAGTEGWPPVWSAAHAWDRYRTAMQLDGARVAMNLILAGLAGLLVAGLALVSCWAAGGSRLMRFGLLSLLALAWSVPAPIAGLGLKEMIMQVVGMAPWKPLASALYFGPSHLPIVWAHQVRFFPCAVVLLWPALVMVPQELRESARLAGARPGQELSRLVGPLTRRSFLWTALVVTALCLSEISASKLVETPGAETFNHFLFDRMHNGVEADVAALCLVLATEIVAAAVLLAGMVTAWNRFGKPPGEKSSMPLSW